MTATPSTTDTASLSSLFETAVDGRCGIRLAFRDKGRAIDAAERLSPSYALHGPQESIHLVYLASAVEGERLEKLVAELQERDDDDSYTEFDVLGPDDDYRLHDDDSVHLERGGTFDVFTADEIDAAFFAPAAAQPTGPMSRINDAEVWGEMSEEVANLPIVLSVGKNREAKEWATQKPARFADVFAGILSKHKAGKKDGHAFVTGSLGSIKRAKTNVLANYMMGLDIDSGASLDKTLEEIVRLGITAVVYTTHSHGSARIEVAYDKYHQWAKKHDADEDPSTETVRQYLAAESAYVEDVCKTAEFVEKSHRDGMKIVIATRPIDKFRVMVPLKRPFVYADQKGSHKDNLDLWSQKVLGMGRMLGVEVDRAARDPSRLFYLPRHAAGATNYRIVLVCGGLMDFDDIERGSTLAHVSNDPFQQAAHVMGGTARGQILSPTLGLDMRVWAHERADGFDIAKVFRDHCDDRIRTEQNTDKLTVDCPFDDDHSNPGDPEDQGTFVQSGGADAETFTFFCSHAGCHGRDRLTMLQKAMQLGWFPDDVLTDDSYDTLDREDGEVEGTSLLSFDALLARGEAEKARDKVMSAATNDALIDCIASGRAPSNAMHLVKARLKIGITDFRKQVESRRKDLRKERKEQKANTIFATDSFGVQCDNLETALVGRNASGPALFNFGGSAARLIESVDHTGPRMILATMNRDGFESECNDTVVFVNDKDSGDGPSQEEALPLPIVKKVWNKAVRDYLLPLRRLVASPIHAKDGSLITTPGYAPNVCALFDNGDLSIPPVSAVPTPDELERAKHLILTDVLGDWCFADDFGGVPRPGVASKAHAVTLLLQPFARELYSGCTPGFLIDKPAPGSGASFLVDVIHRIAHGRPAGMGAFPENEEETRKGLTAKVQAGVAMIVYDNVRRKFAGDSLSMFLTAETYTDRILGETRIGSFPNLGVMVITGNNVSLADENVRRFLPIRLDPRMPESELEGRTFHKPDLDTWVIENRGDLVWACLTLIQNWIAKKRLPGQAGFKSYESFAKVMGGILGAAGIDGFMQNVEAFRASKKVENSEDTDFMEALRSGLQTRNKVGNALALSGFTAAAAHHIVFDTNGICRFAHLNIKVDRDDEHKQKQALGARLEKRLGTYTLSDGTYRFEKMTEQKDGSNQYRFVLIKAKPAAGLGG